MATSKPNNIDEIHNIGEMVEVMNALGISCGGLTSMDEMRKRVKDKLHQSEEEPSWTAGEVSIDI